MKKPTHTPVPPSSTAKKKLLQHPSRRVLHGVNCRRGNTPNVADAHLELAEHLRERPKHGEKKPGVKIDKRG